MVKGWGKIPYIWCRNLGGVRKSTRTAPLSFPSKKEPGSLTFHPLRHTVRLILSASMWRTSHPNGRPGQPGKPTTRTLKPHGQLTWPDIGHHPHQTTGPHLRNSLSHSQTDVPPDSPQSHHLLISLPHDAPNQQEVARRIAVPLFNTKGLSSPQNPLYLIPHLLVQLT
ncbi:uncharacterized protein [Saccopteryx bilineata]|uniref:uncharacterized protein isoform X2 n=1 Tax=Saccopteryx bilineata TaxID=59482 RepID=UPI00338ED8CC